MGPKSGDDHRLLAAQAQTAKIPGQRGGNNYSPKPEYGVIASMTQFFKEVSDDISSHWLPTRLVSIAALLRRYSPSPHSLLRLISHVPDLAHY